MGLQDARVARPESKGRGFSYAISTIEIVFSKNS
jgi:hypothetical protein